MPPFLQKCELLEALNFSCFSRHLLYLNPHSYSNADSRRVNFLDLNSCGFNIQNFFVNCQDQIRQKLCRQAKKKMYLKGLYIFLSVLTFASSELWGWEKYWF